jgi:hypothetical protein
MGKYLGFLRTRVTTEYNQKGGAFKGQDERRDRVSTI